MATPPIPEFTRRLSAYIDIMGKPAVFAAFAAAGEVVTYHTLRHWLRHPPRPITQRGILGILADASRPGQLPPPENPMIPESAVFAEHVDRHVVRLGGIRRTLDALRAGGEPITRRALEKYRAGRQKLRPALQRGLLAILADAQPVPPYPVPPPSPDGPPLVDVD